MMITEVSSKPKWELEQCRTHARGMFEDEGRKTSVGRQMNPGDDPTSRAMTERFRPRGHGRGGNTRRTVNRKRPGASVHSTLRDGSRDDHRSRLRPAADRRSKRLTDGTALPNVSSEADWRENRCPTDENHSARGRSMGRRPCKALVFIVCPYDGDNTDRRSRRPCYPDLGQTREGIH